ncbi:MAG: hypothetical protein RLZZ381_970 [Cyanobacteriota bacterium]|jgi:hypothetical protein
MANINITNLQASESEFVDLSDLELDITIGGGLVCTIINFICSLFE